MDASPLGRRQLWLRANLKLDIDVRNELLVQILTRAILGGREQSRWKNAVADPEKNGQQEKQQSSSSTTITINSTRRLCQCATQ